MVFQFFVVDRVGLRFLVAVLNVWQFEFPLTEESFMEDVQRYEACSRGMGRRSMFGARQI